jgi:hypothetical protein
MTVNDVPVARRVPHGACEAQLEPRSVIDTRSPTDSGDALVEADVDEPERDVDLWLPRALPRREHEHIVPTSEEAPRENERALLGASDRIRRVVREDEEETHPSRVGRNGARGVSPAVSVVMAARNEAAVIGRAVESILGQTLGNWELLVVDDGSDDETATIVERYHDPRIRVLRKAATSLPSSLNHGLRAASAPLVARQDADDVSFPERLERQVEFLARRPEVVVLGAAWREVDAAGHPARPRTRVVAGSLDRCVVRFNPIAHTTAMFRRAAVEAIGGYDENLPYAADYDLWLRLLLAGGKLWNLDEPLALRVMAGTNMSSRGERGQILEELRIRWLDVGRRRNARAPVGSQLLRMALRVPMLLVPIVAKRIVRRQFGKVP